jgi:hypothetical protein
LQNSTTNSRQGQEGRCAGDWVLKFYKEGKGHLRHKGAETQKFTGQSIMGMRAHFFSPAPAPVTMVSRISSQWISVRACPVHHMYFCHLEEPPAYQDAPYLKELDGNIATIKPIRPEIKSP